ncbi:MAG TPA: MFS transporter [Marmoricola sp.]|jgi:EmrB/QacA subfamily drug resistance transporter|nr:MFS transporter [Marmoricola sp.]
MSTTTTTEQRSSHALVTAVVCLALAAVVAAMASLNVALPSIARSTHASQTQLEWVIDAYSLIFASLLLPAGAIGDKFGRRRSLVVGLIIFGAGSAVAMTATSATELIVLRGLLGVGAALVMPATLSTITTTFPVEKRAQAVSTWAAVAGGSAILGLIASGAVLEHWSWKAVFAINVVLAAVALIGTLRVVPESADADAPKLDVVGGLIAVVALVALVFSIIEAPEEGWLSVRTLVGLVAGLMVLGVFVAWELGREHPLLDPRVFAHRELSAGSVSIFIQFFAFFGFTFGMLQFLQGVRGDSPLMASVSVLPLGATLMPVSRLVPGLVDRLGRRTVCISGLILMAVGLAVLAQMTGSTSYWLVVAGLIPLGAGMALAMTPATSAITEALPDAQQGVGSALNDLSRELGGAFGIAVIGSILTATYRSHLHLPGVPGAVAAQARDSFGVAAHLGGTVTVHAQSAFVSGMQVALYSASAAALVGAVLVALLLRPGRDA